MTSLTLMLPFPISMNNMYVNVPRRGRVPSKRYMTWRRAADTEIMAQRPRRFDGPVSIHVQLGAPNRVRRDGDNLLKCIFDALKRNRIIPDDDNRYVRAGSFEWAEVVGAVVTISEAT